MEKEYEIKVGAHVQRVRFASVEEISRIHQQEGGELVPGRIAYGRYKWPDHILLAEELEKTAAFQTLVHELFEAIRVHYDVQELTHPVINVLEPVMTQILIDNWGVLTQMLIDFGVFEEDSDFASIRKEIFYEEGDSSE